MRPITSKRRMYELLAAGALGNTVPQYFDLASWLASDDFARYDLWGVRSGLAGGDKRMRLNVPREDVERLYKIWFGESGGNISPMIDAYAVLRAEAFECDFGHPFGLQLFYVPPGKVVPSDPWRGSFREYGTRATGAAAWAILRSYLWPSDLDDLRILLETYPGHVVEFSACDRAVGVVPHRNTVIWEVRKY